MANPKKNTIFALPKYREVSEWLKEHAWKVCIGRKPIGGSNPFLSAKFFKSLIVKYLQNKFWHTTKAKRAIRQSWIFKPKNGYIS